LKNTKIKKTRRFWHNPGHYNEAKYGLPEKKNYIYLETKVEMETETPNTIAC